MGHPFLAVGDVSNHGEERLPSLARPGRAKTPVPPWLIAEEENAAGAKARTDLGAPSWASKAHACTIPLGGGRQSEYLIGAAEAAP